MKFSGNMLSSFDANAKWELKHYWDDGVTVECRYFRTKKSANEHAKREGYANYVVVPNKPFPQSVRLY